MKLRKSSYCYTYCSFSCYPCGREQHNSYRYNITKPSERVKHKVLNRIVNEKTSNVMHIYDTLQLTVYKGWVLYDWMLLAL